MRTECWCSACGDTANGEDHRCTFCRDKVHGERDPESLYGNFTLIDDQGEEFILLGTQRLSWEEFRQLKSLADTR